jgi:hypothetical protein
MWLLNRKEQRMLNPQACIQVTSYTPLTAGTKQPFHSIITGQLSKKLSRIPTPISPTTPAAIVFMLFSPVRYSGVWWYFLLV